MQPSVLYLPSSSFPCNSQYKAGLYKQQRSEVSFSHLATRSSTTPSYQPPDPGLFSSGAGEEGRVCDAWVVFILLCQCYGPHQEGVFNAHVHVHVYMYVVHVHVHVHLYTCVMSASYNMGL